MVTHNIQFYGELPKLILKLSQKIPSLLYPRHLCRRVYSFRLYVCPFVCSFVCLFVLLSVAWNLRQSFALKFLKWCISRQLLIRKHSYLDHSYPGGLAFTPWPWTPGSMPRGGARCQNLGHLKTLFLSFVMESPYVDT